MPKAEAPELTLPERIFGVNLAWAGICGLASASTATTRYGEGVAGMGKYGFFGLVVIILYATFAPCPALYYYMLIFMALAGIKRITCLRRHYYGQRQLSEFEGLPLVCLIGMPVGFAKQFAEPVMVYLVGVYLKELNPPLGSFFIAGAYAAAFKQLVETGIGMARDIAMSDMRIQMEIDAEKRARQRR